MLMGDITDSEEEKTTLLAWSVDFRVSLVSAVRYNASAWAEVLRCDELHDQW